MDLTEANLTDATHPPLPKPGHLRTIAAPKVMPNLESQARQLSKVLEGEGRPQHQGTGSPRRRTQKPMGHVAEERHNFRQKLCYAPESAGSQVAVVSTLSYNSEPAEEELPRKSTAPGRKRGASEEGKGPRKDTGRRW